MGNPTQDLLTTFSHFKRPSELNLKVVKKEEEDPKKDQEENKDKEK